MRCDLEFFPANVEPTEEGDYLLFNQCDGYHIVEAWIVDGVFAGFYFFANPQPVSREFYRAWAKLPCTQRMFEAFAKKN